MVYVKKKKVCLSLSYTKYYVLLVDYIGYLYP
jgi:hypothetical protein